MSKENKKWINKLGMSTDTRKKQNEAQWAREEKNREKWGGRTWNGGVSFDQLKGAKRWERILIIKK